LANESSISRLDDACLFLVLSKTWHILFGSRISWQVLLGGRKATKSRFSIGWSSGNVYCC